MPGNLELASEFHFPVTNGLRPVCLWCASCRPCYKQRKLHSRHANLGAKPPLLLTCQRLQITHQIEPCGAFFPKDITQNCYGKQIDQPSGHFFEGPCNVHGHLACSWTRKARIAPVRPWPQQSARLEKRVWIDEIKGDATIRRRWSNFQVEYCVLRYGGRRTSHCGSTNSSGLCYIAPKMCQLRRCHVWPRLTSPCASFSRLSRAFLMGA